jgi:hypothetical protein
MSYPVLLASNLESLSETRILISNLESKSRLPFLISSPFLELSVGPPSGSDEELCDRILESVGSCGQVAKLPVFISHMMLISETFHLREMYRPLVGCPGDSAKGMHRIHSGPITSIA